MGRKRKGSASSSRSSAPSSSAGTSGAAGKQEVVAPPVLQTDGTYLIHPSEIYFTFSRIRPVFSCGRTIESTRQQFVKGELQVSSLPLLSVFTDGKGHYFSQNNRRLYLYKQLQEDGLLDTIPIRLRPLPSTKRMSEKYTPEKCALKAKLMGMASGGAKEDGASSSEQGIEEDSLEANEV